MCSVPIWFPPYLEGTPTTQMALEAGMPSLDVGVQVVDNMTADQM